jgi:hypothetical protein
MTWELVALLGITFICATIIVSIAILKNYGFEYEHNQDTETKLKEIEELRDLIHKVQVDHGAVEKLAEETKKLLSQANLAQGLRRPIA